MRRYVDIGLTTFDMADHYGSSEVIAGHFAAGAPDEATTKWVPKPGPHSLEDVRAVAETARSRLQAEQSTCFSSTRGHSDPAWLDCMFYLQDLRDEGLIRHLALTNADTAHLRMLLDSGIEIVSNQVSYSLLDRRAAGAMAELCEERGVKILAFGTVAGGFFSERWLGVAEPRMDQLETWSQMKYKRFIDAAGGWVRYQELLQALDRASERLGVSIANVACRCMLEALLWVASLLARLAKASTSRRQ